MPAVEDVDAGVHFANCALLFIRVFRFDDSFDSTFGIANDAAVKPGIAEIHRQQRQCVSRAAVLLDQPQ